jgi:hypothetical protein
MQATIDLAGTAHGGDRDRRPRPMTGDIERREQRRQMHATVPPRTVRRWSRSRTSLLSIIIERDARALAARRRRQDQDRFRPPRFYELRSPLINIIGFAHFGDDSTDR